MALRSRLVVLVGLLMLVPLAARGNHEAARAHYEKGQALYALEKWDEAIAEFETSFKEEQHADILYNIAQAHRQAGRLEEAARFYRRYLDLVPDAADRAKVEE